MMKTNKDEWANRGALALKFGATMSVLSVVAVIAAHAPHVNEFATAAAPEAATAPASSNAATPNGKLYYFPSEYELNAPEPGEPAPTF